MSETTQELLETMSEEQLLSDLDAERKRRREAEQRMWSALLSKSKGRASP